MFRCILQISVVSFIVTFSSGQHGKFDYECDILTKLDYLERGQKEAKEAQAITNNKLKKAEETISSLINQLKEKAPRSTYVRWGKTTCPGNGTELVYSGLAGGSWYAHAGGAAEGICLPKTPIYGKYYEDALQSSGGFVYGTEYEFTGRPNRMKFFPDLSNRQDLLNNNVPCAVCCTIRSTTLMIPAQNKCMDGWTLEYKGILVSGHYNHAAATDYICLDDRPEYIDGGSGNDNGKMLYFVEGRCGSLPCPPYVNGRELTCSVCSK